ncbi:hypothetical protein Tco_0901473 [Tanacetum coccineum]
MEYLVKIGKKARILELKRRNMKITLLTTNTPYPSRKIRRICACTSPSITLIILIRASRLKKILQEVRAELLLNECMEKAQTKSHLSITNTNNDMNIELSKEFLTELQSNAYHGKFGEDVVDHIAKVLEMLDLIKILNVDTDQLRVKVFPLSLADDAKQWWKDKWDGKITARGILVGRFFCKYFPISRNGKNYVVNCNNADESGYYKLMAWLDSRQDDMRIDRMTKNALCHSCYKKM